jgi:Holliday junction resolvase RusA-like endonuclease
MTNTVRSVRFTIEGAPVAKGRPRIGKTANGKPIAFTPKKTRSYEDAVKTRAKVEMLGLTPIAGPVVFAVCAYVPIPKSYSKAKRLQAVNGEIVPAKRPDIDNYVKAAMDACNGVVLDDDSLVADLIAHKRYSENPRLEIEVTEWRGVTG